VRDPARELQRPSRGRRDRGVRDARGRADEPRRGADGAGRNHLNSGYVGILTVELHFPEAASLKGKRKFVKSAKAQLANRFGAAVAEVDHHELWQRTRLSAAVVAREAHEVERLLDEAERWLAGQEWELVRAERTVVSTDDD
jgi:uncharacterized protein YlxP (DUF503 family)